MLIFNERTLRALSAAILILGISIAYAIYTSTPTKQKLVVKQSTSTYPDNYGTGNVNNATNTPVIPFSANSFTSIVGNQIFSAFTKVDNSANPIDDSVAQKVSDVLSKALEEQPLASFKEYKIKDISVNDSPTTSDLSYFVQKIIVITDKYRKQFESLSQSDPGQVNSPDEAVLVLIAKSSPIYQNLAKELATLSVPINIQEGFLDLLNSYSLSASGLSEVKYYSTDPLRASEGLRLHSQASILEQIAISEIRDALKSSGIIFTFTPLSS